MNLADEKRPASIHFGGICNLNARKWKSAAATALAAVTLACMTITSYASTATGTATGTVLVREKASTSSTALSTIKKGQTVTVLGVEGDWVKVKDGSRTGYIAKRYLDIEGKVSTSTSSSSSSSSSSGGSSQSSVLRKGDENEAVKAMQKKLIALGFLDTDATGRFGSATKEAVKAFQKSVGLSADGVVGSSTMSALLGAAEIPVIPEEGAGDKGSQNTSSSSAAIQKGDEGASVTNLQKMLIELGYLKTDATGYFGSATKTAVTAFQKDSGLAADGVAGKATVAALEKKTGASNTSSSSSALKEGDENDQVKQMQQLLIDAGYLNTKATGFFGSLTAAAVRAFQKDHDLKADGVVGQATMTMLKKSSQNTSGGGSSSGGSSSGGSSSGGSSSGGHVDDGNDGAAGNVTHVEETRYNGDIVLEDWWSGKIDSLIKRGQTYTVTDVATGKSFRCARYGGSNHLDSEPYTAEDAAIMEEIFDYNWTWSARAILLAYDGVTYAAAMNGMPHGGQKITTNNFNGQFCIHFLNSRTHGGDQVNQDMQARIMEAFYSR